MAQSIAQAIQRRSQTPERQSQARPSSSQERQNRPPTSRPSGQTNLVYLTEVGLPDDLIDYGDEIPQEDPNPQLAQEEVDEMADTVLAILRDNEDRPGRPQLGSSRPQQQRQQPNQPQQSHQDRRPDYNPQTGRRYEGPQGNSQDRSRRPAENTTPPDNDPQVRDLSNLFQKALGAAVEKMSSNIRPGTPDRYRDNSCFNCKEVGHFAAECPKPPRNPRPTTSTPGYGTTHAPTQPEGARNPPGNGFPPRSL
jgi:hypothetical protein